MEKRPWRAWRAGKPASRLRWSSCSTSNCQVDGLEVLRRIKTHLQFRSIPVVVLTTSAEEHDVRAAYQLGANSYIVKPVDLTSFYKLPGRLICIGARSICHPGEL